MILAPHILAGAVIGAETHNFGLIIILGLLSHLILDHIPHWDYSTPGIKHFRESKNFKNLLNDLSKNSLDGAIGISIVIFLTLKTGRLNDWPFILTGIFFAVLPDVLLFTTKVFCPEKISQPYINFHHKFFHGIKNNNKEKEGKITFLGIITEVLIIIIATFVFFA